MPAVIRSISPQDVRKALIFRNEIALIDVRYESSFALDHPLFAAQMAFDRITLEAANRLPRKDVPIVLYDDGEGLVEKAAADFAALGYTDVSALAGGLGGWRVAGYELFQDVNSYSKAFGELVEARRHTPSLSAPEVGALLASGSKVVVVDVRRYDEYNTMNIPGSVSVPSAELVARAPTFAADPDATVIINCAGRTRSIIGTQSLVNTGLSNKVFALRNGTIGWTLAGQALEHGSERKVDLVDVDRREQIASARSLAYRAGVRHINLAELAALTAEKGRTLYRFDVRLPDAYAAGHLPGFTNAQGGQLVQEIDMFAPVRGARIVLSDDIGVRADMTASWLAQMGWDVYMLEDGLDGPLESGETPSIPAMPKEHRYKRPYEGTDNRAEAMQAYLDWEFGLVAQLERDGTHGFYVI